MRLLRGVIRFALHHAADGGAHASTEEVGDFALDAFGGLVPGRNGRGFLFVGLRLVGAAGMMLAVRALVI
jgi:hypothetical protein